MSLGQSAVAILGEEPPLGETSQSNIVDGSVAFVWSPLRFP